MRKSCSAVVPCSGKEAGTDDAGNGDLVVTHPHRPPHDAVQLVGEILGFALLGDAGHHQGKAVLAGAGDKALGSGHQHQATGHFLDQLLALLLGQAVDDPAEAPHVEQEKPRGLGLSTGGQGVQVALQMLVIGQAGEVIVEHQIVHALPGPFELQGQASHPQFPLDGGGQTVELVLADEIPGPQGHDLHHQIFPQVAGENDEGQRRVMFRHPGQGIPGIEGRQVVVAHHHVPALALQGVNHLAQGLDPGQVGIQVGPTQALS